MDPSLTRRPRKCQWWSKGEREGVDIPVIPMITQQSEVGERERRISSSREKRGEYYE